jgi:hypothetical protein
MPYAAKTSVPVERSRAQIEKLVNRHGGAEFGYMMGAREACIMFQARDRRILFRIPIPEVKKFQDRRLRYNRSLTAVEQQETEVRRRWRALLLCIKGKLEGVANGVEIFDDAFLAQIVLPNGRTVSEQIRGQVVEALKGGTPEIRLLGHGDVIDAEPIDKKE